MSKVRGKTTMLNILNENTRLRRINGGLVGKGYEIEIEKYRALKIAIEDYFTPTKDYII